MFAVWKKVGLKSWVSRKGVFGVVAGGYNAKQRMGLDSSAVGKLLFP